MPLQILRINTWRKRFNIGVWIEMDGQDKEAENCYIKALEIDQGYTNAFVNLATLYLNQGNNELGLATLEQALRINPRHLGALLTKANTLLLFEGKAMDAVAHFRSVDIASTGADNFPQYRYWYALALHAAGDDEAALAQVEIGLALRPDNRQLLEAKAGALSDLRKRDVKFEEQARLFMEFRVQAYPEDFGALTELTDIYQNRGEPGMAWQAIETNLALRKFDLKALVEKVGFSLVEMKAGFQHASEYQNFREHARLTDHCAMMCGAGLQTSREILPVLDYALMPLYARLINRMKQPNFDKLAQVLLFQETLSILSEIFPAFGSDWLCAGRPDSLEEQNKLILTGSLCLMDVITIELARIYGYVASWLDIPIVISDLSKVIDWADVQAGVMVELISRVGSEWSSLATTPIEH